MARRSRGREFLREFAPCCSAPLGRGILGLFLPTGKAALALFIGTGSIAYLGMFISRFTGEHFLDRSRPKNTFDSLFFLVVATALQATRGDVSLLE